MQGYISVKALWNTVDILVDGASVGLCLIRFCLLRWLEFNHIARVLVIILPYPFKMINEGK